MLGCLYNVKYCFTETDCYGQYIKLNLLSLKLMDEFTQFFAYGYDLCTTRAPSIYNQKEIGREL